MYFPGDLRYHATFAAGEAPAASTDSGTHLGVQTLMNKTRPSDHEPTRPQTQADAAWRSPGPAGGDPPPAVLFDLDGTLTDPRQGITRSFQYALSSLGRTAPPEKELLWCIGPPLAASFAQLLETDDPALVNKAVERYRERFGVVGLYENRLYAGVPIMLAEVREMGCRVFLATSKLGAYARRILDHFELGGGFDGVYGSELDGSRSDKGALIAHILAREGLAADSTVMVGDREHDMRGAAACGVRGIGVTYGYGSEEELRRHGAARLADSPAAVATEVAGLLGNGNAEPC